MKLKSFVSLSAAGLFSLLVASVLPAGAQSTGKIHGHVLDPSGLPRSNGTVSLTLDQGHTLKYTFPIQPDGSFSGDGIAPGTYTVVFRIPDMPAGQMADEIESVKVTAGEDTAQDVDMSRKAYLDKLSPEQRKTLEDAKKQNAEVIKGNQQIKNLNADLAEARADNKDKKYDLAEAIMLKDTAAKPDSEILWFELASAQIGEKKWDDATVSLKKSLDLANASKKPNPELLGGIHSGLGEVYARTNKPADAAPEYDAAATANPAKAGSYYANETAIYFNTGQGEPQAAAADKAIAADPKNPLPYYLKGQALAAKITVDAKGNYIMPPGCVEAYTTYLDLAPDGQFAAEVKSLLAATNTKVENKYKAKK